MGAILSPAVEFGLSPSSEEVPRPFFGQRNRGRPASAQPRGLPALVSGVGRFLSDPCRSEALWWYGGSLNGAFGLYSRTTKQVAMTRPSSRRRVAPPDAVAVSIDRLAGHAMAIVGVGRLVSVVLERASDAHCPARRAS